MAAFKLSIEDVRSKPESFLYIFASTDFCRSLGEKAYNIIMSKKANQLKVLTQSAQNAGLTIDDYANAIREGFINTYGMTPAEALVRLAQGEEVAGKNWAEGVYGVGALYNLQFAQAPEITVDPKTGKILKNGSVASCQTALIASGYPENVSGYSYTDPATGSTYSSRYRKVRKEYYAHLSTDKDGNRYTSSGTSASSADGSMWENTLGILQKLVDWIISVFGYTATQNVERITAQNTSPSQADGFVTQEAGVSPVLVAGMVALAAGTLLNKKGKKK